eukprot:gene1464-1806_t
MGATETTGTGAASAVTFSQLKAIEWFDGKKDAQAWVIRVERLGRMFHWPKATYLDAALVRLTGAAQTWALCQQFQDWDQFTDQLKARFSETKETAFVRHASCKQQPGEAPRAYADRFLRDACKAGKVEDAALIYTFIKSILPDLVMEVERQQPQTIEEVVDFCEYWIGCHPHILSKCSHETQARLCSESADYYHNLKEKE